MIFKKLLELFTESPNTFEGQEPHEKVVLFLRRHPFVIIIRTIGIFIAYFIPIMISIVFIDIILTYNLFILYMFILSVWTIFVWLVICYSFTMYTLDVWIITDHRIIDSTQHGFFNRTVSELHISRIQDIYVNTEGVIQTFLNYGDLFIQTAGTEERFKFQQIPNPVEVKNAMMKIAFPNEHQI